MKYGIIFLSLLLFGCNDSVEQRKLDHLRKNLDALNLDAQQYDKDYARQTADYDRQTKIVDDQQKKFKEKLSFIKNS